MQNDPTKILMGTTQSSYKVGCSSYPVEDVADFPAGTAVRLNSDGGLSTVKADGALIGVSLGKDLSDTSRIVVLEAGLRVPVLLDAISEFGQVVIGQPVWIDDATGLAGDIDGGGNTTTVTRAIYVSDPMTGVDELGEDVDVALIDFAGGL